jgi:hypothetical protein
MATEQDLSRREQMSISGSVLAEAPWVPALATGGVIAAADLGLHVLHGHLNLAILSGSVSAGAAVLIVVAAAGAVWRARSGRASLWARNFPWKFAVLPALTAAVIALVLTVVTGGGVFHGVFSAVWHGAAVYGLTGGIGTLGKSRKPRSS